MKLKLYYKPGSAEWLRLNSLLDAIVVQGRAMDKEQRREFLLKGKLPRLAQLMQHLMPDSPDLLTEPVTIMSMPGFNVADAGVPSGPYAVHVGGGMYARNIRLRQYSP